MTSATKKEQIVVNEQRVTSESYGEAQTKAEIRQIRRQVLFDLCE